MASSQLFRDPDLTWRPMAASYATWMRIVVGVPGLIVTLVAYVIALTGGAPGWVMVLLVAVLALATAWLVGIWAPRWTGAWAYAERADDLVVTRGRLIRRLTVVPYARIQVIELESDPLRAALGLARLKLVTASASTDAVLPALEADEAGAVRDHLATRGASQAADL